MDDALVWLTIAILVLMGVIGVVAAFYDRKRSRKIERDLRRRPGSSGAADGPDRPDGATGPGSA